MRFFRFFTDIKLSEIEDNLVLTDKGVIHKVKNVLRLKEGDNITLFDGDGFDYECEITDFSKDLSLKILNKKPGLFERSKLKVNLFVSLIKRDKLEWILEKGTEIGVLEFHPIISERSEKKDFSFERGERKIIEALEQSGRNIKPKLFTLREPQDPEQSRGEVEKLEDCLTSDFSGEKVFLNIGANLDINDYLADKNIEEVNIFVGPEGGWSEREKKLLTKNGFKGVNLNTAVLKTETACLSVISKILI